LALLIGLVLTPVGALIGTVLFFSAIVIRSGTLTFDTGHIPIVGVVIMGLLMGLMFVAPVTLIVLPVIYRILRRRFALSVARLTIGGALFGFVSILILVLFLWGRDDSTGDWRFSTLALGLSADGAIAGTACAFLFGRIMRRLRPRRIGKLSARTRRAFGFAAVHDMIRR
jgi:hypothetical protein